MEMTFLKLKQKNRQIYKPATKTQVLTNILSGLVLRQSYTETVLKLTLHITIRFN